MGEEPTLPEAPEAAGGSLFFGEANADRGHSLLLVDPTTAAMEIRSELHKQRQKEALFYYTFTRKFGIGSIGITTIVLGV